MAKKKANDQIKTEANAMRKYENVDIAACLGAVLEINTEFYKSDFKYDIKMFTDAAKRPDGENNRLVWLSRHSGTECFGERDIYLIESQAHHSWTYYADARNDTIRAYAVEIKGMVNGRATGDLYELNYREYARQVQANALHVASVSVKYADGTEWQMPYKEWTEPWESLYHSHGTVTWCRRDPEDETVLSGIIENARAERESRSHAAVFKVGIRNRHPAMSRLLAGERAAVTILNHREEKTMAYNHTISASDPQAVEKLTERLQSCEALQTTMKAVNAHWRKTGTCQGAPGISDEQAAKLDTKVRNATVSWERQPFSSYNLTNNNAEIKRLKTRIAEITRNREVGFAGWEFDGGRAEANTALNRLQLIFDERPDKDQHSALRHAGFVYSHTNGAYQRQLNDSAIYAVGRLNFIQPTDGRTVREHQPKPPARNAGAR
jgi:hypothetical protein